MRMHSSIDSVRPALIARKATARLVGERLRMVASVVGRKLVGAGGALQAAHDVLQRRLAKNAWRSPAASASSVSRLRPVKTLRAARLRLAGLGDALRASAGRYSAFTVWVARPDHSASPYPIAVAGQAEIHAEAAAEIGQQVAAADIGKEADADLRHGELRIFGHHPVRAVERNADAAAHDDAVDQRDIRFRIARDLGVQPVFVGEELDRRVARRRPS